MVLVLPPVWVCMFALITRDISTITTVYGTCTSLTLPTEIYLHKHQNTHMIKNAIFDEERRAITYADRRTAWYIWTSLHRKNHCSWTPDKDTSAVSITTVTFKNLGHATRLTFIQSTKLYALPVQHGNLQRRINIIRNSNPTQLNSNGARRKRGSNNRGGSTGADQSRYPHPHLYNKKENALIKVGWLWKFQTNTISI